MLRCHLKNWKLEYYKKKSFSVDFSSSRLLFICMYVLFLVFWAIVFMHSFFFSLFLSFFVSFLEFVCFVFVFLVLHIQDMFQVK